MEPFEIIDVVPTLEEADYELVTYAGRVWLDVLDGNTTVTDTLTLETCSLPKLDFGAANAPNELSTGNTSRLPQVGPREREGPRVAAASALNCAGTDTGPPWGSSVGPCTECMAAQSGYRGPVATYTTHIYIYIHV